MFKYRRSLLKTVGTTQTCYRDPTRPDLLVPWTVRLVRIPKCRKARLLAGTAKAVQFVGLTSFGLSSLLHILFRF